MSVLALTFNHLLRLEDVDPASVVLVRHRDAARQTRTLSVYRVWKDGAGVFEPYQAIQARRVFEPGQSIASFVVTPPPENATLFIGLYRVDDVSTAPDGSVDPVFGNDVSGAFQYMLSGDERLSSYVGTLRIAWGAGARSWRQLAANQDKPVTEIRNETEPAFPGFAAFECDIEEVEQLPGSWVDTLRTLRASICSSIVSPGNSTSVRPSAKTALGVAGATTRRADTEAIGSYANSAAGRIGSRSCRRFP